MNKLFEIFLKFKLTFILLFIIQNLFSQADTIHLREVEVNERYNSMQNIKKNEADSFRIVKSVSPNLGEILKYEPGINVKSFGDGGLTTVSFRGADASHTKVEWNGMQINSAMNGQVDFSLIPVFPYSNVNMLYGANSMISSNGALGGLISFNSPAFDKLKPFFEIKQEAGSFGLYNSYLGIASGKKYLKFFTQLSFHNSNNNFTYTNNAVLPVQEMEQKNAEFKRLNFLQDIMFQKDSHNFSLHYWQSIANRNIPQIMTNVFSSNHNEKQEDKFTKISGLWDFKKKYFDIVLNQGISYSFLQYNLRHYSGNNLVTYINSISNEKQYFASVSTDFCLINNVHFNTSLKYNYQNVSIFEKKSDSGYNVKNNDFDIMANLDISKIKRLNISLLTRFIKVENYNSVAIPSLFIKFLPVCNLVIKSSVSKNTKFPSLNDLYYIPGGNINLKPENAIQSDLSFEFEKNTNSGIVKSSFKNEIVFFYNNIDNWILWQPTQYGYWSAGNVRNVISKGIQAKANCKLNYKKITVNLNGAYTLNIAEADDDSYLSKQLPYLPVHSGNIYFRINFIKYEFNFEEVINGNRLTSNYESYSHIIEPLWLTNISSSYFLKLNKSKLSVEIKINNLFNSSYQLILWRPMAGRNASIVLSFKI